MLKDTSVISAQASIYFHLIQYFWKYREKTLSRETENTSKGSRGDSRDKAPRT